MSSSTWKQRLTGQIAPELEEEVDRFASQIQLRQQGRMDEKVFAETRLRRGGYGQRYDNGQRHDGRETRALVFDLDDALGERPFDARARDASVRSGDLDLNQRHLPFGERAGPLDQPVGERRFPVIDMGDDREIADVFEGRHGPGL